MNEKRHRVWADQSIPKAERKVIVPVGIDVNSTRAYAPKKDEDEIVVPKAPIVEELKEEWKPESKRAQVEREASEALGQDDE